MEKRRTLFGITKYSLGYALLLPGIFFSLHFLNSCRKAERDDDTSTKMVRDNAHVMYFFEDIIRQAHRLALSDSLLNTLGSSFSDTLCIDAVTHTNTPGYFPDTILVDYGNVNGAACYDGLLRKGKLKIMLTGKYGSYAKTCTVSAQNYSLNGYTLEGNIVIFCLGKNAAGNLSFSVQIENGKSSNDSLQMALFAPSSGQTNGFQREWVAGASTITVNDDVFMVSGNYGGVTTAGASYKSEIISPLRIQNDCSWIVSGKEKLFPSNLSPRETDYGSGCNALAVTTINGKEFEVTLLP